jgi:hypothetical protein
MENPMTDEKWEIVDEVYGELQAEILRGLLEAQGIQVVLNQEGAGRVYGLNVGTLGQVQILVPSHAAADARQILEDYYTGKFEEKDNASPEENEPGED